MIILLSPTARSTDGNAKADGTGQPAPGLDSGGRAPMTTEHLTGAVKVNWVRKVYSDERWSGWPDIAKWDDTYYVCFANGTAHGTRDHRILLLSSRDLERWDGPRTVLGPPGDHLESFFLETDDRLLIQASWRDGDVPVHMDVTWSMDGQTWSAPTQAYRDRHIFWGQSRHAGKYYVAAHIDPPVCANYLLESDDGDSWQPVSLISDDAVTETTLCFLESGDLMALSRRSPRDFALASFAAPPYTEWRPVKTDTVLEGAALARLGGRIVAISRGSPFDGQQSIDQWYDVSRRTGIFFYEDGRFERQASLPSGGDTGYPGILPTGPREALVVYYSEHERMDDPDYRYKHCAAIYLASITVIK